MHRITKLRFGFWLALGVVLLAGCAGPKVDLRDQPIVERLRIQISKARNAIEETRSAIAEARGAAHLTELYVRLAELLSEEARYHYQIAFEREQSGKSLHVPQVRFLKEKAISFYELVLARYPTSPLIPRVLFNKGQEHRELGQYEKMRSTLLKLVEEHKDAPLRQDALLILGDDQFDRNNLTAAGEYYRNIVEGPLSRLTGLAHYKLAWVFVNQADCKPALTEFENAIKRTEGWYSGAAVKAQDGEAVTQTDLDVRREALVDLVYCFTQERKAPEAVPYLRTLAYRRGAYVAALEKLAARFGTMDQAEGAIQVARELLILGPDSPQRIDDARLLHAALIKAKEFNRVGDDTKLMSGAVLRQVRQPGIPTEERERLLAELEQYIRDLATRAQALLEKMPKKDAKRPLMAAQVAQAYELHITTFPDDENHVAMLKNLVDVLEDAKASFEAGRYALAIAAKLPDGVEKLNALYDGLVHLQTALDGPSNRMLRVVARAGIRKAGSGLIGSEMKPERARRVKFAIAETDFDEGRYGTAIERLNAVAMEYPKTEQGDEAVHLILESYRTLNDYLGLIRAGRRFLDNSSPVAQKIKDEIAPIVRSAEQHQLDELALAAAAVEGSDVTGDLEKFAKDYSGTDLGERALINALLAARAAGDSAGVYRLADEIEEKYPKSKQMPGIRATIARTAASRFELDKALGFFRRAADVNPTQRVALLVAEGRLRAELADYEGAKEALNMAVAKAETPAARAQASVPLAELMERSDTPTKTIRTLQPLAGDGQPSVLAHYGIALIRQGDRDNGEAVLQEVLDAGSAASTEARARAYFGQAEVFAAILDEYEPESDIDSIQELVTLVEVTEQSYLKAAREGSPVYTAAAFGRLAYLSTTMAGKFKKLPSPTGVPPEVASALKKGFGDRATRLERQSTEALAACAEQGWVHHIFPPAVRICMEGTAPSKDPVSYDQLSPRTASTVAGANDALRIKLSKNPEDVEALRGLGEALLDGGDAHTARLVLARAVQSGGGPIEANLLGIACYSAGDKAGSLEAFTRAATGGLEIARDNLIKVFKHMGMPTAAGEVKMRLTEGRPGGRAISLGGP